MDQATLEELLERIDAAKRDIDARRPFPENLKERVDQQLRLLWNYHSNNIEGNSFTFGETKSLLLHGITASGKPLRDALEIRGHNDAIKYLEDIVAKRAPVTQALLRELHRIIIPEDYGIPTLAPDGSTVEKIVHGGEYKSATNHVRTRTGEIFYFAEPYEVGSKMTDLLDRLGGELERPTMHPIEIATNAHYDLILIHPFDDGNGRLARILMNLVLMRFELPPAVIRTEEKSGYYEALRIADGGERKPFTRLIAREVVRTLQLYMDALDGKPLESTS